ncbi:MAG: TrkH family potassium uptake protein [Fastidiosipilaceae bacterium]|jgi:trk system potassium uptake protein TrkH|nr:Trk family potassium uptake protein [Clostridiaceae bacterium]
MSPELNERQTPLKISRSTIPDRKTKVHPKTQKDTKINGFFKWLTASATRLITLSFALVILIGTGLLTLPVASADGHSVGLVRALFTATSATCVTGLVIGDTALTWTTFGHIVILLLIQIGGLGLITIMSFFMLAARRKMKLKTMLAMQESVGTDSFATAGGLVKRIILVTASCELIGGLILTWRYALLMPFGRALGTGLFQGVSAFCNAGFDLLGTFSGPYSSLVAFNSDPVVLFTTALLIIIGGLGFVVWDDIVNVFKTKRLHYHSRLVLTMTGLLLLVGTIFFALAEWNNTGDGCLGSLPVWQRPIAAFFHSVTLRTAGFNSIDQTLLTHPSKIVGIFLMFTGAGPASTGGGVKVTTMAILFATISSYFHGREGISLVHYRYNRELVRRALVITSVGMLILLTGGLLITFFEASRLHAGDFTTLDIFYEMTSGFATVGVTSLSTPTLTVPSWLVLIAGMYLGRVGPASFAIGVTFHQNSEKDIIYPEGKTFVG